MNKYTLTVVLQYLREPCWLFNKIWDNCVHIQEVYLAHLSPYFQRQNENRLASIVAKLAVLVNVCCNSASAFRYDPGEFYQLSHSSSWHTSCQKSLDICWVKVPEWACFLKSTIQCPLTDAKKQFHYSETNLADPYFSFKHAAMHFIIRPIVVCM